MENLFLLYRFAFLFSFMLLLISSKFSVKKTIVLTLFFVLILWAFNISVCLCVDMHYLDLVYPVSVSLPAFLFFLIISDMNIFKVLFSFLTVSNFAMFTSFLHILTQHYLGYPYYIIVEFSSVILTLLILGYYLRKPYLRILTTIEKGWRLTCTFPLVLSAIMYSVLYYPDSFVNNPMRIPVILLLFILMFDFYLVIYKNIENIFGLMQYRHDKDILMLQTDMHRKEYNAITDKYHTLKIFRHDMRHHISILYSLLSEDRREDARKYLNRLNDDLTETIIEKHCDNFFVNLVLSNCITKARQKGIIVSCVALLDENFPADPIEIGIILTNSIDNAIISCSKIEDGKRKYIDITCKEHYGHIYIQVVNPYRSEIKFRDGFPISDQKNHGMGTRSIASIARKYNGTYSFVAETEVFKMTVILPPQATCEISGSYS